jgi:serine/threonine-protein kinase
VSELRFGPYRVVETLGAGALSSIYKAVQEPLGRVVAVKALKTEIAPTSSFGAQLERESKVLADLAHPNIVMLLDVGRSTSGRPYLVLEHVDGPPLAKLISKKKKVPVEAALAIAIGMTSALEHAHDRGVVHRDVKPSNVLLTKQGNVKMIDFGIAQRARMGSVSDALGAISDAITPSGRMAPETVKDAFGTPAYMSPEQILGDFVDGRSDLFSLGVVLYEMLSGTRPFSGSPLPAPLSGTSSERPSRAPVSAQRIRRDDPAPLRERAPHVPRTVDRIVMRMLEKSAADRYPSAGAVRERLDRALRAITRDDPAEIVRATLAEAGLVEGPRVRIATASPADGLRRSPYALAFGGQALVLALFLGSIVLVEGTSCAGRDVARASGQPLVLAPERAGGLRVVATPWAKVRVDGQDVETTPFARAIPLTAGAHWVTLTHPDAPAVEREVMVTAGEIVTLDVTMNVDGVALDAGKDAR